MGGLLPHFHTDRPCDVFPIFCVTPFQERRRNIVSCFTNIRYLHFAMHIWAGKLQ